MSPRNPTGGPAVRGPGFTYEAEWPWVTVTAARVDWHKRPPLRFVQVRAMERRIMAAAARHPDLSTADRFALSGLIALTLGYVSPVNRLTWTQVERVTGLQAKNLTRHVDALAKAGFVTVSSAAGRGRSLVQVHNQPDDDTLTLFDSLHWDPDEEDGEAPAASDDSEPAVAIFPQGEEIAASSRPDLSPQGEETDHAYLLRVRKYHPSNSLDQSPHPEEIDSQLFPHPEEIGKNLFPHPEDTDSSPRGNNTLAKGSSKGTKDGREVGGREARGRARGANRQSARPSSATAPHQPQNGSGTQNPPLVLAAVGGQRSDVASPLLESSEPPPEIETPSALAAWCIAVLDAALHANYAESPDEQPPLSSALRKRATTAVAASLSADPPCTWAEALRGLGHWAEEGYRAINQIPEHIARVRDAYVPGVDADPVTVWDHVTIGANLVGETAMRRSRTDQRGTG